MKPLVLKQPAATPVPVRPPEKPSAGVPLVSPLRASMEQRFGADFSQVRVHADEASEAATRRLDADAFTSGNHLHFAAGRYEPATADGQQLVAHELAHLLQQRAGGTTPSPGESVLEQEADHAADAVAAGRGVQVAPRSGAPSRQRKPKKYKAEHDDGHATVAENMKEFKGLFVQWRTDLTDTINAHCGRVDTVHDHRFVLMLAQRSVEQDGPRRKAEGNNPYNVMGHGDATPDQFFRKNNKEGPKGKQVTKPAHFAAFTGEGVANDAYLRLLERQYPVAFAALSSGGSTKDFVNGLYPGSPDNYATADQGDYRDAVKMRARLIVGDLRRVYGAHLVDYQAKVQANPPTQPAPVVAGEAEINQLIVTLLTQELLELDDLTDRIASDGPVNRPAATGAAP